MDAVATARGASEPASSGRSPSSVATVPKKFTATSAGVWCARPALATMPSMYSRRARTLSTISARPAGVARSALDLRVVEVHSDDAIASLLEEPQSGQADS